MRRPIAAVLAAALTGALLTTAPTAQATLPTATWSGAAGGDTTKVGVNIVGGLNLADARLAVSQADAGSTRNPRATATSTNLGASVAGLPLSVLTNTASAGPSAGSSSSSPGLGASAGGIVTLGALDASDSARWAGDNQCVTGDPLATASTTVASVKVAPPVFPKTLLTTTSAVRTTGTTQLAPTSTGSLNQGVTSTATASALDADVLGLKIGVTAGSTLSASANGRSGGGSTSYDAGTITVDDGQNVVRVLPGTPRTFTLSVASLTEAAVTVTANSPTTTVSPAGTSTDAKVSVVTVAVTLKAIDPVLGTRSTTASASIDLLPLRASAGVPSGGIDCPPAAPTVTTPADGSRTNDTTPTFAGTGVPGATVALTVDQTVLSSAITVGSNGTWTYDATSALSIGSHDVSATQTVSGTPSPSSAVTSFTIDTSPPAAPVLMRPANGSTTADNTPDCVGAAEAGSTVDVYEGSTRVATGTANASGAFTLTSDRLDDGPHTVRAVATDAAGNVSTDSTSLTFTVDSTAPAKPVILVPADQSSTQQTRPAISGTAEVGSSVAVKVDGTVVGTVVATDGTFSVTPTTPLPQGAHVASATATDAVGNTSDPSASVRFSVDTSAPAAPVITTPPDGGFVAQVRPPIKGTAEAGSSVQVLVDGVAVGRATAGAGGAFSVTPDRDLAVGTRSATAVATDAAGNVSPTSAAVSFTIDLTAPAGPVLVTPANGSRTRSTTPTYTGTAEAGSTVTVYEGSTPLGTGTATSAGTFSIVSSSLGEGTHAVRATATDAAGNVSVSSNTNTFTIDTTAPDAPAVTAPTAGAVVNDATPTISGTTEANASVEVLVDGQSVGTTTADGTGHFSLDSSGLGEGGHTVRARARDDVGNVSALSAAVAFRVDTRAPAAPVLTTPADGSRVADTTPSIRGRAEAGATVTAYEDTTALGSAVADAQGAFDITSSTLSEGDHAVFVKAVDGAGNVSAASGTNTFAVDLTAPAVPVLTTPAQDSRTSDRTPTYTGSAEAGASVSVYEGTTLLGTGTANGSGAFSIVSSPLEEGQHVVYAQATDPAGNVSSPTADRTFTVDRTPPAAPTITVPENNASLADTTPTISGNAEPGAEVEVFVDGLSVGTATADGQGAWSLESTALTQGVHGARAQATDVAQNTSGLSGTTTFTIDVTAPDGPALVAPGDGSRTTDPTPSYVGVAEPGSTVTVYEGTTVLGTGRAAPAGGAFSVTSSSLGDGLHTVFATATDAAGNVSGPSNTNRFTVDATAPAAPVITVPGPGDLTRDTTPTISGSAESGARVDVYVDGLPVGTTTAADNAWTLDSTILGQGQHTATARATDAAGNRSPLSDGVTFTVDAQAPAAPTLTTPPDGSTTADTTPTYTGRAETGATVTVFEGSAALASVQAVDGAFSVESSLLGAGPHTVYATATDPAGNESSRSSANTFTIDASVPSAPVLAMPADGSRISDRTPTYTGTAETGTTVRAYEGTTLLGSGTAVGGAFSIDSAELSVGQHTVFVTETNAADVVSPPSNANTFTIDVTAPDAPEISQPTPNQLLTDATPTISGSAEADTTVEVSVDGSLVGTTTADGQGRWSLDSTLLADGDHVVRARAVDEAGNRSDPSAVAFRVDANAPDAPTLVRPVDGSTTRDRTPAYQGTAEPGATVTVYEGITVLGSGPAAAVTGAFSFASSSLADGLHRVFATATDSAGNVSMPSGTNAFTVDATVPAVPVVTVPAAGDLTQDTTPTISGTAEAGVSVAALVDGDPVGTADADGQGHWSLDSTPLGQGAHEVTAQATDAAGNSSAVSDPVGFTVDSRAPAAPTLVSPADGSSTTDTTPTYAGTAELGATVTVYEGTTPLASVRAAGGTFSVDSSVLGEGTHTVYATATDPAGNVSARSGSTTFSVDTAAPAAPVLATPADASSVSDRTPTYTGTAEAGTTVKVYEDTTLLGTGPATGGSFSIVSATLGEGAHTVFVTATDAAGNVSVRSNAHTFTVDVTQPAKPTLTAPADSSSTDDPTPTYTGRAEAGSTVRVYEGALVRGTGTADADGAFGIESDVLAEGPHTVFVTATDAAGNVSVPSGTTTFTVDTVAPLAPVLLAPANGSRTTDSTPTYSGTAVPGTTVTVYEDATVLGSATAGVLGGFQITSSELPDGGHAVYATSTDAAGNVSVPSNTVTFTVDATPPATPVITSPADGSSTRDTTPTIKGTAEAGVSVEVFVDGTSIGTDTASGTGAWSVTAPTLGETLHTATAVATDRAGNGSGSSDPVTFRVDTTDPAAPTITDPANGVGTRDTTPLVKGTAEGGSTVEVFVDGLSVGTTTATSAGAWSLESTELDEGQHVARAVATDAAGNGSLPSAAVMFTVDLTRPGTPVVESPADGSTTTDSTPTTSGRAEAGVFVEVFVDEESIGVVTAGSTGAWTLDAPQLVDGTYEVTAKATDAAGNASSTSQPSTFTVDTTGPAAPTITAPQDGDVLADRTPTITGTAEQGASVEVFVDGRSIGSVTATDGSFSIDAPTLDEAQHSVSATATDAIGNVGPSSASTIFFVDVTKPLSPVVLVPADGTATKDATPTISGTAEIDGSVEVFVDGRSVGTTSAGADHAWTLDSTALDDGQHVVRAVATDAAGNASAPSDAVSFTVDATAPAGPELETPANGSTTSDTTPTVSGAAPAGSSVEVFLGGVSAGKTTATDAGRFSLDLPVLLDGSYTVYATAADALGNVSAHSNANTFTVDTEAPAKPQLTTPANGSSTKDTTPTYVGTAEAGTTVTVYEGTTVVGSGVATGGSFSIVSSTRGEGPHTVFVTATDGGGNVSADSNANTFTVDVSEPAPVVTAPKAGSSTNDTTPTITGTAGADDTVEVFVDGESVGTTIADGSGSWSLTPIDFPGPGSHTVTATATDALGNVSGPSAGVSFSVDVKAPKVPVLTTPANGSTTSDTTPTYVGTAEIGSTVDVYEGTKLLGSGVATDGTFSIVSSTLDEGDHTVFVTATDGAGNVSDPSKANTFTIDVTAPAVPVVTAPQAGSTTNEAKPTIEGTADAGAKVEVFVDGESVGRTTASGSGTWSLPLTDALDDGDHTVHATAADALGNTSEPSADVTFTVDATAADAPVLTLPADQTSTKDTTPTYVGTAEAGTTVKVYEGMTLLGTGVATGGSFSIVSSVLGEGPHTVFVTATDGAGNVSVHSNANTFTVDVSEPAPVVTAPKPGSSTNDTTPTITGTAGAGDTVEVFVDGESVGTTIADGSGNWSLTPIDALDPGSHAVSATATDALGNVSSPSAGVSFTVDTTRPAAPVIIVPTNGSTTKDTTPTISGTAEGGATVEVFVDGTSVGTTTATSGGAWSLDSTVLGGGEHTATAVATDAAGNGSDASTGVTFTIDATAPDAPVILVPDDASETTDATPTISGTAEPTSTVEVVVDGTSIGTVVTTNGGTWTIDAPLLDLGDHDVVATATDAVGNVSGPSDTTAFTVVEGTSPAPGISSPGEGSTVDGPDVRVCGTGVAGATVILYEDGDRLGSVVVSSDGTWCLTLDLPDGSHTVDAVQVLPGGEVSAVNSQTFGVGAAEGSSGSGGGSSHHGSHSGLASTGGPSLLVGLAALVLLGTGAGVVVVSRRRRRRS